MGVITSLNSFLCLITLLIILPNSTSKPYFLSSICSNKTMFSNNTLYQTNLNTLLRSLASNAATNPTGFHYTSVGNLTNNAVHGLFLCRGDQNTTSCSDCVSTATTDLPGTDYCPSMKVATILYDECTVRYSNASFYREMDQTPQLRMWNSENVTGNMTRFLQVLGNMMDDLVVRAKNGGSSKKYATDYVSYSSLEPLYGMVQCTSDLSSSQCDKCLRIAIRSLPISFGGRAMVASCFARYEVYPFFNGAADLTLPPSPPSPNNSTGTAPSLIPPTGGRRRANEIKIILVVLLFLFISVAILIFVLSKRKMRKKQMQKEGYETHHDQIECVDSVQFDFDTIQFATDNFSDVRKLSTGSATATYKGVLPDGQEIAVKLMNEVEFDSEFLILTNLQHKNLVKLLGFCIGNDQRFLVYEFLPNDSLQGFLHDSVKRANYDWQTRYGIIQGVARGLCYLHEDSQLRVIHRDLNPSNILLGVHMDSKISNFRKAILVRSHQTQTQTQTRGGAHEVVGTYGYMSPEYVRHGDASVKSDVFSCGVILLEIITGQAINDFSDRENEECLLTYAWRNWCQGTTLDMVDEALREAKSDENQIKRCIKIAFLCVEEDPNHRPSMSTVVLMLNSNTFLIAEPIQPSPLILSNMDLCKSSSYEASISELDPR